MSTPPIQPSSWRIEGATSLALLRACFFLCLWVVGTGSCTFQYWAHIGSCGKLPLVLSFSTNRSFAKQFFTNFCPALWFWVFLYDFFFQRKRKTNRSSWWPSSLLVCSVSKTTLHLFFACSSLVDQGYFERCLAQQSAGQAATTQQFPLADRLRQLLAEVVSPLVKPLAPIGERWNDLSLG